MKQIYIDLGNGVCATCTTLLDTQADGNFMSSSVANRHGIRSIDFTGTDNWTSGGGAEFRPRKEVPHLSWGFRSHQEFTNKFYIIDDAPFDIVIGKEMISKHEILVENPRFLLMALKPLRKGDSLDHSH